MGRYRSDAAVAAAAMVACVAFAAGSVAVVPGGRAATVPTSGHGGTASATTPQALQTLRRLANELDAQGRSRWRQTYTGVELDANRRVVYLFATDAAAARALSAAARRADPRAEWNRVRFRVAAFSRAELDAAAQRLITGGHLSGLSAVSAAADGSGLTARVTSSGSSAVTSAEVASVAVPSTAAPLPGARPPSAAAVEVPVRVQRVAQATSKSWADVKWHDSSPFIGGDVLTSDGHHYCTAGLPAVRRSNGQPVLITAAHCFPTGTRVYTGGGTTDAKGNGRVGNYVGTVGQRSTEWDAEPLTGANNNADESDTSGWKPLTSVAYSYVGDYVCQAGAASFYLGHPTPCGIKVTNADLWFRTGGYWARGVEGVDVAHGWGSHNGDSGGTVFAVEPGGVRQARGIVSSGGLDGTADQKRVDWIEAPDIFHAYDLKPNPRT